MRFLGELLTIFGGRKGAKFFGTRIAKRVGSGSLGRSAVGLLAAERKKICGRCSFWLFSYVLVSNDVGSLDCWFA